MFVRVRLIFEERSNVLLVPEQTIVPDMKSPFVYRVVDGKAVRSPVKTGLRRNAQVEIVEGIQLGDEVVTAGQMKLRDGVPVKSINMPTAPVVPATEAVKPSLEGGAPSTSKSAVATEAGK